MKEMDTLQAINLHDEDIMKSVTNKLELKSYKYRELCELLGEEYIDSKNSHGKDSQLKRWQRFFEFEKKGHSIIITKIYDVPTPKIENRGGNKPFKYLDELQYILIDYLENTRTRSKYMPISIEPAYIMKIIGMINFNYSLGSKYRDELAHYLNIDKKIINNFYTCSYGEFTRIIENAFDKLQDKGIIQWEKTYRVNYKDDEGLRAGFAILNKEDYKYVQDIEKDRMEYMGFRNKYQVISSGKMFDFKQNVIKILNNDIDNDAVTVASYVMIYRLQLMKNNVGVEYAKVLENTKQLNIKTTQRIKDKVEDIYENYIEEESNIDKEEYKIGNNNLIEYMFDLVEYDIKMGDVLKKYRHLWYQQKLVLPSKFDTKIPKVKYVTKKQRKKKAFEAERDALGTAEEWEDLFS